MQYMHGGDIYRAINMFGGNKNEWLDLSTCINLSPYPLPNIHESSWRRLPEVDKILELLQVARGCYSIPDKLNVYCCAGVQSVIQILPLVTPASTMLICEPTYSEYKICFERLKWNIKSFSLENLPFISLENKCVLAVNPNNPTGMVWPPEVLHDISTRAKLLIIDESFMDTYPDGSFVKYINTDNVIILRSCGKFYGLAGARLGFAISSSQYISSITKLLGPWPVSGPAIDIGIAALSDKKWSQDNIKSLQERRNQLDDIALSNGWKLVGGTHLFGLYETEEAAIVRNILAKQYIWIRTFNFSDKWIRIGTPGLPQHITRLEQALRHSL